MIIQALILFAGCPQKPWSVPGISVCAAAGISSVSNAILETEGLSNVQYNYASSGVLARHIQEGAEADIFISANRKWIDHLSREGFIDPESIRLLARNRLVVITAMEGIVWSVDSIPEGRGVIGDPAYVPVGEYARQVLESLEWWKILGPNLIRAKDVNAVLRIVELGEADWGIVYASELQKSRIARTICMIPQELHEPVEFYIALTRQARIGADEVFRAFFCEQGLVLLEDGGFDVEKEAVP